MLITLLAVGGLVLLWTRFARAGRRLLVASLALVAILGVLPAGKVLMLLARAAFPALVFVRQSARRNYRIGRRHPAGTLGGPRHGFAERRGRTGHQLAALARRFPDARIVFTGGSANLIFAGPPESAFMLDLLASFGIPRTRVQLEERSRNTLENARFTKALIDPKPGERWLLVTSAMHMPRAVGVFRQAGFPVEAYPVDWNTRGWIDVAKGPVWPVRGLDMTDFAMKEWNGLFAYWLAGYTPALLPGPEPDPHP